LPAGKISLASAWALWALSAAGLVAASWFLNRVCFYLSPIAITLVCFYSFTKRFTDYTHVFLGIALALAPIGAWLAVKGEFGFVPAPTEITGTADAAVRVWAAHLTTGLIPIVLALSVVFWLVGFDVIYALQDYEFDRAHGLHSLVVAWGPKNALRAAFLSHLIMCGLLLVFGLLCRFRVAYVVGWILIVICLLLEHWIARRRSLHWVQNAFFRLNAVVSMAFLGVTVAEVVFKQGFRLQ
jgi:4-hydroxybenzoate polyprenyltransferase